MIEKLKLVGKKGTIRLGALTINVKILDFKTSYGHERWLVEPVSGMGKVWVEDIKI